MEASLARGLHYSLVVCTTVAKGPNGRVDGLLPITESLMAAAFV